VRFINTDGMSFVGTGSEWFWLAVTAVVLGGTGLAVFREVRLQTSAHEREQLFAIGDQWYSERFVRMKLEVYRTIRAGGTAAEAPRHAVINLCNFWEKYGALTQGAHIRPELMFEYGTPIVSWWITAEPLISASRASNPESFVHFAWLVEKMNKIADERGITELAEPLSDALLDRWIAMYEGQIRIEESLRAVTFVTREPVTVVMAQDPLL
jgi:hypothetical protein